MSNYNSLKATINANIKTNGNQEITGAVLNSVLNAMVNTLGAGYQYAGIATPSSNPGTPDARVFYLAATPGTYTNFGSVVVSKGEVCFLKFDTTWSKDLTGISTKDQVDQISGKVNGLAPLTEYVGRLESTSAVISNVSTYRYMVVPVNPGDIVALTAGVGGCFYYVVSTFTFNPTLPYNLVLANGETARHNTTAGNTTTATMPSNAAFLILRGAIAALVINGRDVLKSMDQIINDLNVVVGDLSQNVDTLEIEVSQKFYGITGNQYFGDLTNAATIVQSATKKYVVISVRGGQVFKYKRTDNPSTIFYVVRDFTPNPTLPYNLELATGESSYHAVSTANYEYSLTLPNDAKFILMISEVGGADCIPEFLTLDGENIINPNNENEELIENVDALVLRDEEGYYRATSPYRFSPISGWYGTELIPVYPGDKIITNTTYNTPYNTVGHLCFDKDGNYVQLLDMVGGESEITQEMFDLGVRFVGISYDKTATPSPELTITRNKLNVLESKTDELEEEVSVAGERLDSLEGKCRIVVAKNGSLGFDVFVYDKSGKKVRYHFTRYLKVWDSLTYTDGGGQTQTITNFTSADMWGNDAIYNNDDIYIIQGNTNFICQVYGDTRHIGDQHGNEVLKVCKFFADGVEFSPLDLTTPLACHEFRWMWKSDVYSPNLSGQNVYTGAYPRFDTSGNPIVNYTHFMEGILNDSNELKLDNRLCIKRDGLKFNAAFGAMLECNYGDFSIVSVATNESTINSVGNDGTAAAVDSDVILSSNPNQLANKAVMMGDGFVVEQSIDVKSGTPNVHCEFYVNRLKIYFMPVKGDTYKAESWQPDEFNTGDQIRVHTYRKIDI